jgi:hypothetical protein
MATVTSGPASTGEATASAGVGASWSDVRLLAYVAAADLVFAAGIVVPYLTRADHPTTTVDAWLGYPALTSLLVLPLLAVAVGAAAATRLGRAGGRRRLAVVTLLLAVAGFAAYVSPVGVAATRWFLD